MEALYTKAHKDSWSLLPLLALYPFLKWPDYVVASEPGTATDLLRFLFMVKQSSSSWLACHWNTFFKLCTSIYLQR